MNDQRDTLTRHLDGVGVAELVRRETSHRRAPPCGPVAREPPPATTRGCGSGREDAEQRTDGQLDANRQPLLKLFPGPLVHADLAGAGLVRRARRGRRVLYERTAIGNALVAHKTAA